MSAETITIDKSFKLGRPALSRMTKNHVNSNVLSEPTQKMFSLSEILDNLVAQQKTLIGAKMPFFVSVPPMIDMQVRNLIRACYPELTVNELMYSIKFEFMEPYAGKVYFYSNDDDYVISFSMDEEGDVKITRPF